MRVLVVVRFCHTDWDKKTHYCPIFILLLTINVLNIIKKTQFKLEKVENKNK